MKTKYTYFILVLSIAASLAIGGCGAGGGATSNENQNVAVNPNPVIPSEDPQAKLLREGNAIKGVVKNDCDQSFVLESLNTLCELFGAGSCLKQISKCNDYSRQIYTGSTLVEEGNLWNGRGGSGHLMVDAVSQNIDLSRVEFGGHNFNPFPFAGGHQILFGYGLNLSTEEKSKSIEIKPPAIEVITPLGPFSVQPVFNYESNTGVADAFVTDHTYWILPPDAQGDVAIKLSDLYGIMPGVENNTAPKPAVSNFKEGRTGWISQIGLGNRGTGDDDVWSPPKSGPFSRPDYGALNFLPYESRSDKENRPSVYAKASAPLTFPADKDPYKLLPDWVKPLANTAGIKPTAYIQVTPTIEAGTGGQFGIALSEGTNQRRSGEFDVFNDRLAALGIYSGVRAGASFNVDTLLRIKVTAGFNTPLGAITKDIIDISPHFPETLDSLATFKELKQDPKAFIAQCYAKENEAPPEEPPKPEAEKGKPEDLFPDEIWPCNICIATDAVTDSIPPEPAHSDLLLPAQTAPVWKCDAEAKSGCMDLCKWEKTFDEAGKPILTVVKGPKEIADDIPPDDPQHDFFMSCMVSCVDNPTPVSFGNVTAYPCVGDATPPAIASTNATNTAGPFPTDANIAATFNESMDGATINGTTFMVSGDGVNNLRGTVTYNTDTKTATFTPSEALAYSTTYTATITAGVTDAEGNALAEDYSWNFTTVAAPDTTPPTVISKDPADDASGVAVNSQVRVTFSEPIDTSAIVGLINVYIPDG